MIRFELTRKEIERLKCAADAVGFPWQAIAERPRTARRFLKRVEAEMARQACPARTAHPAGPECFGPSLATA